MTESDWRRLRARLVRSWGEDVAQETLLRLWLLPQVPLKPGRWCHRVARRVSLNLRRGEQRARIREESGMGTVCTVTPADSQEAREALRIMDKRVLAAEGREGKATRWERILRSGDGAILGEMGYLAGNRIQGGQQTGVGDDTDD